MSETKRVMSEEHKRKLREAYYKRKMAKERGIILPTKKQEREEAFKAKREHITEKGVNELISKTSNKIEDTRINNDEYYNTESEVNRRHPLRFREIHEQIKTK